MSDPQWLLQYSWDGLKAPIRIGAKLNIHHWNACRHSLYLTGRLLVGNSSKAHCAPTNTLALNMNKTTFGSKTMMLETSHGSTRPLILSLRDTSKKRFVWYCSWTRSGSDIFYFSVLEHYFLSVPKMNSFVHPTHYDPTWISLDIPKSSVWRLPINWSLFWYYT